jgi:hypothetical protein
LAASNCWSWTIALNAIKRPKLRKYYGQIALACQAHGESPRVRFIAAQRDVARCSGIIFELYCIAQKTKDYPAQTRRSDAGCADATPAPARTRRRFIIGSRRPVAPRHRSGHDYASRSRSDCSTDRECGNQKDPDDVGRLLSPAEANALLDRFEHNGTGGKKSPALASDQRGALIEALGKQGQK